MAKRNPVFSDSTQVPNWLNHAIFGFISGFILAVVCCLIYTETKWYIPPLITVLCVVISFHGVIQKILSILTVLVSGVLALCLFTPILQPIQQFLDVTQLPSKADVIVILGGGQHCGSNDLAPSSLARTIKGLALWKAGYAPIVTVSDTAGLWDNCISLEQSMKNEISQLEPRNPPEIFVLPGVKNTRTEAQAVAKEAKKRGWQNILIVTSPIHSRRARATFTQLKLQAFVVGASEPEYDTELHLPHDRLMALPYIAREVAGLVKYSLLGWF